MSVNVRVEKTIIPTYEIIDYDKNPMFLEKRVYQGSSGRVYPHPVCEGVSDVKTDKEYEAVFLENDYIEVMILPELGGRIQRLFDKTNGYDAVYYNEVVKPALVGLAGPWISGGIEFNWPQHHRPSTFDPVDYRVIENEDGSVTVWCGETEKMFHTKGEAGFTVYPDKAYLEIKGRVYNPTEVPKTFLWWANPAVSVNDFTMSVFPPDVNAVYDHGKRDVSKFPIADGIYYKVNYAPGTDISRYKNIPVPTSYMAHHSDFDFIGNYDEEKEAGLLHVADHHVSPGKKQWTWGNGDFGRAWDRNLTDENGPYIELMTGMFTDNQPDFTFLKPYEEKNFVQYFMPYKKCGAIKNACRDFALNLEENNGKAYVCLYSSCLGRTVTLVLKDDEQVYLSKTLKLSPCEAFETRVNVTGKSGELRLELIEGDKAILKCEPVKKEEAIPHPAKPMEEPKNVKTNEELFLDGMHLEQYRHATYSPADYYLEGLRRDPSDIRINNAYGMLLYRTGHFEDSIPYFKAAIAKSVMRNPNPYDCEPYYNLGLALSMTGKTDEAFDAFYKATWDANMQDKSYYRLSCIAASKGDFEQALEYIDKALDRGRNNLRARHLKTVLLRLLERNGEAVTLAKETLSKDPLDMGALYELSTLFGDEIPSSFRGENADFIELAIGYMKAGLFEEAARVLSKVSKTSDPMPEYYLFYCTGDEEHLKKAEKASSLYCFPNRIEDINVLKYAIEKGGLMAAYYLGCLWYDKGDWKEAVRLWSMVENSIILPTVHRNLALAYYNKLKDSENALKEMETAFSADESDARVLFELDQLYKELEVPFIKRLEFMRKHESLLETRDPLYTEFITLLNRNGEHEEALSRIKSHIFHPWEGGEGKITAEYRKALIELSKKCTDKEAAVSLLKEALVYPHNLGEGKLVGQLDNDIYYYLGKRSSGVTSEEYFRLGARGELNLSSAMYYNDQPPEMMFFIALCLNELGKKKDAEAIFDKMTEYGKAHMGDEIKIDYFAVSLPDFLVFETDLNRKNRMHCENMINLGTEGRKLIG